MELKTRRVAFAGCTTNPNEAWMKTVALELTNHEDGFLKSKKYLIMDRDATFSKSFRDCLRREGVKPVRLAPRTPNLNAQLERFFGSLKTECLHKLILFGEKATRRAVRAFLVIITQNEIIKVWATSPSCRWIDRLTWMPQLKRPSVLVAYFGRIDALLSSAVFTRSAPPWSKNGGVMSAAQCRRFRSLFSQRRSSGLNFDRNPGHLKR